jgi:hypothetical protein
MNAFSGALALSLCVIASPVVAQTFSSGSTGADGALDLATSCTPYIYDADPNHCYVQLPPSGVLNYTTMNVPTGRTLRFRRNLQNTPAVLLVQASAVIAGTIDVSAGEMAFHGFESRRIQRRPPWTARFWAGWRPSERGGQAWQVGRAAFTRADYRWLRWRRV